MCGLELQTRVLEFSESAFYLLSLDCAAIVTRFSPMDNGEISEAEKTGKIFIGDLLVKVQGIDPFHSSWSIHSFRFY